MKYLDEYRSAPAVRALAQQLHRIATKPWTIMEICGGQTHAIVKFGLDELLPKIHAGARAGLPGLRDAAGTD